MATRAVKVFKDKLQPDAPPAIPDCAVCNGKMVLAYDRYQQKVCVCTDCHTSITIPGSAWDIANHKREARVERATTDRRRVCRRASDRGTES